MDRLTKPVLRELIHIIRPKLYTAYLLKPRLIQILKDSLQRRHYTGLKREADIRAFCIAWRARADARRLAAVAPPAQPPAQPPVPPPVQPPVPQRHRQPPVRPPDMIYDDADDDAYDDAIDYGIGGGIANLLIPRRNPLSNASHPVNN